MKLGVVSDTHNNVRNVKEIIRIFNDVGVDHVIHTGDITRPLTLELFKDLGMPLSGVFGNNDQELESLIDVAVACGFNFGSPPMHLEFSGQTIVVVHDPRELTESVVARASIALHGHTHLYRCERQGPLTIFNPGECAGHLRGLNAVGVVHVETGQTELLKF